jgi:xanthine/uracil permease
VEAQAAATGVSWLGNCSTSRTILEQEARLSDTVHPVDEHLPAVKLLPLAIQHVLVMYAGAVAVPLIIGRAVNLNMFFNGLA